MDRTGFASLAVLFIAVVALVAGGIWYYTAYQMAPPAAPGIGARGAIKECGHTSVIGTRVDGGSATDCFLSNFANNIPAKMVFTKSGVDGGATYYLTSKCPDQTCTVAGYSESYSFPGGTTTGPTFSCANLANTTSGFALSGCLYEVDGAQYDMAKLLVPSR